VRKFHRYSFAFCCFRFVLIFFIVFIFNIIIFFHFATPPQWTLTVYVSVVADFKALTIQFNTKLCSNIQTLNLAQNPQLRLHFVSLSYFYSPISVRFNSYSSTLISILFNNASNCSLSFSFILFKTYLANFGISGTSIGLILLSKTPSK